MYTFYFYSGTYEVEATSVKEAFKKLHKEHPECITKDLIKVMRDGKEV